MPTSRLRRGAVATLGALAVVAAGIPLGAAPAGAASAASRTAYDVTSYCSTAGGLQQNLARPISVLRLSVSPASPRAGKPVRLRVFVDQAQPTPEGLTYPRGFVRGEVQVGFGGRTVTLVGPSNRSSVSGPLFPGGWTAKGTVVAPDKSKAKVRIKRIAYNVRGGGSVGGWSKPYTGFDLVCAAAPDPTVRATAFAQPRLTVKLRRP